MGFPAQKQGQRKKVFKAKCCQRTMPIHPLKRIEDRLRDVAMRVDYAAYLVTNPFKFQALPKKINRILVVEMLQLGDILVATPAFKALKDKYKSAKIDVLINPATRTLVEGNKHINEIISYTSFGETLKRVSNNKYDLAIILHPGSLKISALLLLAKVKYRVGATKAGVFSGKGFFLNKKIKPNLKWQHKIEDNLDVLRAINIHPKEKPKIEVPVDQNAKKVVAKFLKHWKGKKIMMHMVSKHKSHHWMPERVARLADALITKYKATLLFTGTKGDIRHIEYIRSHIRQKQRTQNIAGRTNMRQLVALTSEVNLVVTVDTSVTHIASATDTPVVVLFGPTVPIFWGPSSKKGRYIWKEKEACVGCRRSLCIYNKGYECMRSIYESEVLQKIAEVFP